MPYDCGMNLAKPAQRSPAFLKSLVDELELEGAIAICNNFVADRRVYFTSDGKSALPVVKGFRPIYTAGQHPHHASSWKPWMATEIEKLADTKTISFVGECGLDYNRMYSPVDLQQACFAGQIHIAQKTRLPLYLHCRDAWADFWALLAPAAPTCAGGILHVFSLSPEAKKAYFDLGPNWLIGLTRRFPEHITLEDVKTRVVVETDAPFFGDDVWVTARIVAKHVGATESDVMKWSDANLRRLG